jgi:hypothetical protein
MTQFLKIENEKPLIKTVFTHILIGTKGWVATSFTTKDFNKVTFLGRCNGDGDMFACESDGYIEILKGKKGNEFN